MVEVVGRPGVTRNGYAKRHQTSVPTIWVAGFEKRTIDIFRSVGRLLCLVSPSDIVYTS